MNQWVNDSKKVLLDLKISIDQQVIDGDGGVEEVYIPKNKRGRIISLNKTNHLLNRESDNGGIHLKTYTDPDLPRPRESTMYGCHHVTAMHSMAAFTKVLPPVTFL